MFSSDTHGKCGPLPKSPSLNHYYAVFPHVSKVDVTPNRKPLLLTANTSSIPPNTSKWSMHTSLFYF